MHRKSFLLALSIVAGPMLASAVPAKAGSYRVVHSFKGGSDGFSPFGGVLDVGGALWGTAELGSANNQGVVFQVEPKAGSEIVRYSFRGGSDGSRPEAGLTNLLGTIYGTTNSGGSGNCSYGIYVGCGTVFAINPATGAERIVYNFQGGSDGVFVGAGLINLGGLLYGTTSLGGTGSCDLGFFSGCGTVFALNPRTGAERVLHSFGGGKDGAAPQANLIFVGGKLYGTTYLGGGIGCGGYGCGTIFAVDPRTGAETVVYAFKGGSDGGQPAASLTNVGGSLFGTTYLGGTGCSDNGCGTVFSVNLKTNVESVVYAFKGGKDGSRPAAGLTRIGDTLYGTTVLGGDFDANCSTGCGTIFSIDLKTSAETVLQAFKGLDDGANPYSSLTNVGGSLYGTTENGGAFNHGAVFVITP